MMFLENEANVFITEIGESLFVHGEGVLSVEQDRSDAIVLGCAGMADLCEHISSEIGVPVVDGVAAATLIVQSLVTMGLRTGKRNEYATPLPKRYTGLLAGFGDGSQ